MDKWSGRGDTGPHGSVVAENDPLLGWLTEDAHIGATTVAHQVVTSR